VPRVFLSSTIRDLGDLRSAIKYWLEENGYEVLASEWPDFPQALDRAAVAAALAPIGSCDYYVLMIGGRVGTVIPDEGISVTRAEFRQARSVRRGSGLPNMLHLVRREVSEARRVGTPAQTPDEEWPAIKNFISEVETEEQPGDPNWLREFDSFRDVVDVLRATLNITGPLTRRALEANLLWELRANTRELLSAGKAHVQPQALWYPEDLSVTGGIDVPVDVTADRAFPLFWFRFTLPESTQSTSALEESINSGQFLDYEARSNSHVVGPLQRAMLELRQQIDARESTLKVIASNKYIAEDTDRLAEAVRNRRPAQVYAFTARFLYAAWTLSMNVLRLNRALYRTLLGMDSQLQLPELLSQALPDEAAKMRAEQVTDDDADRWLRSVAWQIQPDKR
jgi:Domain of unknown function (DUF4062)